MASAEWTAQSRVFAQVFTLELRRQFTYRVDFWLTFAGTLTANVLLAHFLWTAVFRDAKAEVLAGYDLRSMILYYVLVALVENITRASIGFGAIANEIYEGTLTRYLVYPTPFFVFRAANVAASACLGLVQLTLALTVYFTLFGIPESMTLAPKTFLLGTVTACAACALNLVIISLVEMAAFWAENVWTLNVMLMFAMRLLGGALLPLALFPELARRFLPYLPFPYLLYFPIQAFTGQLSLAQWLKGMAIMGAWGAIFAVLAATVWRRGNLRFTGVGI